MDAGRAARRPRRRAAAQSAPSLEADGVAIVASPPKPAPEVVVLSSSDDEEPEQHDAAAVGAPKKNVPAERKRRRTTPAAAVAAPAAPRKRRRRAVIADTGASAASAEGEDSGGGGATTVAVKQEADGGWPAEFQPLRALPFERVEYERLRAAFFTEYDVYAGARESLTRGALWVPHRSEQGGDARGSPLRAVHVSERQRRGLWRDASGLGHRAGAPCIPSQLCMPGKRQPKSVS